MFSNIRKGGESDKVHNAMKSYIGHLPGVTSELTPYIIHVSAVDQMSQQPILNISGEILCGGWSFKSESCLFYYIKKYCM